MKTLIVGLARSGTSALLFKLKSALPSTTWCLFEPSAFDPSAAAASENVLVKTIIGSPIFDSFRDFDKKILLVRDPRDNLVSRLLYHPTGMAALRNDQMKVDTFVEALRGKEADPGSISFRDLFDLAFRLSGRYHPDRSVELYTTALDFHGEHRGLFVYKYEDFILGRYAAIESYLGIALPAGEVTVDAPYQHVERAKAASDWKHWFTADDVSYFRPRLSAYMDAYGYADDWTLADEPHIRSEHSSEFVRRSVAMRIDAERRDTGSPA
jgi:hypothetical protein